MRWALLLVFVAIAVASNEASAGSCGRDSDNPMVWGEGFGVSQCRIVRTRYHANDYSEARKHADSSDPMVWPSDQWGSTLFNGYSRHNDSGYDRRVRRSAPEGARVVIEQKIEIVAAPAPVRAADHAQRRGPKLIHVGHRAGPSGAHVSRFDGHRCKGVLVLSWGTLGSKAHCYSGPGRLKRMFAE